MGYQYSYKVVPTIFIIFASLITSDRSYAESMKKLGNFRIYWNVPTFMCHKYGYNFSSVEEEWGIIQNYDDQFRGDKISILYDPGLFPALLNTTTSSAQQLRNGGVPQEGKINSHLDHLQFDIERLIPDKNFRGLAIIDFEHWRPIWRENWGSLNSYRIYSRQIEKKIHPWWSDSMIEKEATKKFEKAAKEFMEESLRLAKLMRPSAIWGYYGYPFCFNFTPNNNKYTCTEEVIQDNNRLKWLFKESTALFPSMYLKNQGMTSSSRAKFIMGRMEEASRLSEKHSDIPIYSYTWYKYPDVKRFLSREDLMNSFEIPKKNGANGIIIWGATNDVSSKVKCAGLYDYLQRILGPIVLQIKKKLRSLSTLDYENDVLSDNYHYDTDNEESTFIV